MFKVPGHITETLTVPNENEKILAPTRILPKYKNFNDFVCGISSMDSENKDLHSKSTTLIQ